MPRRYRGMDIFWWLETTGRLARTIDDVSDPEAARREASLQHVGRNDPTRSAQDLDLGVLQSRGVRLVGRLDPITGHRAHFRGDLATSVAAADGAMYRLLDSLDRFVERAGLAREVWASPRPRPVEVPAVPEHLNLRTERIGTVLVAAGYRPERPWLPLPTHADGSIRESRGVTPRRASTSSASGSSTGATPATSTAPGTARRTSSPISSRTAARGPGRDVRSRWHEQP